LFEQVGAVSKVTIMYEGGTVAPGFKVVGTDWQRR
jgi:hypothetical protein